MRLDGKTKKTLMLIFILSLIAIILLIPNISMADIDTNDYKPNSISSGDAKVLVEKVAPIVSVLQTIGVITLAITTIILGIKYMMGSTAEKAEYKKTMIPYIVGAVLVVAITQILSVVIGLIEQLN